MPIWSKCKVTLGNWDGVKSVYTFVRKFGAGGLPGLWLSCCVMSKAFVVIADLPCARLTTPAVFGIRLIQHRPLVVPLREPWKGGECDTYLMECLSFSKGLWAANWVVTMSCIELIAMLSRSWFGEAYHDKSHWADQDYRYCAQRGLTMGLFLEVLLWLWMKHFFEHGV